MGRGVRRGRPGARACSRGHREHRRIHERRGRRAHRPLSGQGSRGVSSPGAQRARRRLRAAAARGGELGTGYALLDLGLAGARWVTDALEDRLLAIEGRRGVYGPAHRAFPRYGAMGGGEGWAAYDWSAGGEEWTASETWKESLVEEVLVPGVPEGSTVVELGPGAGRWSAILRTRVARLVLVEATDGVLSLTRERFGDDPAVTYLISEGASIPAVPDASVDAVWSFDVFVHLAPVDVAGYVAEMARVLRAGGVATIHHAGRRERRGRRAPMTAALFASLAREAGLIVERQFDSWGGGRHHVRAFGDVISVLRQPGGEARTEG